MGIICENEEFKRLRKENKDLKLANQNLDKQLKEANIEKNEYLWSKTNLQMQLEKQKNDYEIKLNDLTRTIKSFKITDDQITNKELNINKNSDISFPEIIFQKEWTSNCKNLNDLDKILKYFMDKIIIHESYFSNRNDNNLEKPLKILKEKGLESLRACYIDINKDFKNECKQKIEELFNKNITSLNNLCESLTLQNKEIIKNIYIKKYERQINYIKINKNINEIKHFTVLVIGKSGVGKSCLINNILELKIPKEGQEKIEGVDGALEKKGGFVTKINEAYISKKIKGIRCIDTPGCDLNGHGVQFTINECKEEIQKQYNDENGEKKDPSNYVMIIWYCFNGNRFDDESDVQLIKKIRESYKENQIPVIIVKTEAYYDEDTEVFRKILESKNLNADYIGVVAKEKPGKPKKNLDKLVELSISKIKEALNGEFYKVLCKEITKNLISDLKKENENINIYTKEKMVIYFRDNYCSTLNDNDLVKFINNLLIICFSFYLVEFKNDKTSYNILEKFDELIIKTFVEKIIKEYNCLTAKKVNDILFEKSLLLLDLQAKIQRDEKSNINAENINTMADFASITRNFLCENLFNTAQKILIELILKKILFPLCDLLKDEYNKNVDILVKDTKVEKFIQETYKLKFEELKEKIMKQKDQYNRININESAAIPAN